MPIGTRWIAHEASLLFLGTSLAIVGCGEPPFSERMVGMYATDAVQADLKEHEKEFVGGDLHAKFDAVDRAEAQASGEVWARLRLEGNGRFEFEGPATDEGKPDARLSGRWTASSGAVVLAVEQASPDAETLGKSIACPATPKYVEIPFLKDPKTSRAVRLARR